MKIAYWSHHGGDPYQVDHMAAISTMLALRYQKRVIMMDNGYEECTLEKAFRGINRFYYVKEDSNYCIHRNGSAPTGVWKNILHGCTVRDKCS